MSRSPISAKSPTHVTLGGRSLLAFVGTDYLGLSAHEKVLEACREGLERYGLSASASRVTSGTYEAHVQLEEALAEFLGLESALVLPSGDLANQALLESMEGELDRILIDADSHTSLVRAARANGAPRHDYGPGDPTRLLALCDRFRGERLAILTDAVFPAKGRLAPIAHLLRYAPPKALVVVDDSHGMGVLDKRGRGTLAAFGTPSSQVVVTFSLAKSLGAFGGALVGPAQVIETVRRRSEVYQGGTALPPAVALAARTALGILEAEPERVRRLHRNIRLLHEIAASHGRIPQGSFLPVWNIEFPDPAEGQRWHTELMRLGIFVPFSHYPSHPGGALRISVCSEHSREHMAELYEALASLR